MIVPTKYDTSTYEVEPHFDDDGVLTSITVDQVRAVLDEYGLVVLPGFLSDEDIAVGRQLSSRPIAEGAAELADVASETDMSYRRRDFHAVPWDDTARDFVATLVRRTGELLQPYCDQDAALLELIAMYSYPGSSHQYLHRDPEGALSFFLALDDIDSARGGTVYVPRTHTMHDSAELSAYRTLVNFTVMGRNLRKLARMRLGRDVRLGPGELKKRVFSSQPDQHQPNIRGFLSGSNQYFSRSSVAPRRLASLATKGPRAWRTFDLVGTTPSRGSLVLWNSNIVHAGPDNRSQSPRSLMCFSLSRTGFDPVGWRGGYAPHSNMIGRPTKVAELASWSAS